MDLKRKASEQGEPVLTSSEQYPWGLSISLEEPELNKLDMTLLPVGTEVQFFAKAKVTSAHENADEEGTSRSLSLQITSIDIPQDSSREDRMYKAS